MNTTLAADEMERRPFNPVLRVILYCLSAALAGFVYFFAYALSAQPILSTCSGGAADSVTTAAILGLGLVVAGAFVAARTHRAPRVFVAFAVAYPALLLLLWELSPLVWGARTCTSQGLF